MLGLIVGKVERKERLTLKKSQKKVKWREFKSKELFDVKVNKWISKALVMLLLRASGKV